MSDERPKCELCGDTESDLDCCSECDRWFCGECGGWYCDEDDEDDGDYYCDECTKKGGAT